MHGAIIGNYQSHQTGIETRYSLLHSWPGGRYQSHQTGIETINALKEENKAEHYQSHQTGIETTSPALIIIIVWAINRTKPELKQI